MPLKLCTDYLKDFVSEKELLDFQPRVSRAFELLTERKGEGSEFTGWLNLPEDYDREEFGRILKAAEKIRKSSDLLIVIGIGGSYLGARAVIEFCKSSAYNLLNDEYPQLFFAGNSLSPDALSEVMKLTENRDFSLNVISKSGTTLEPAAAFRALRALLCERYGEEGARERIFVTTDRERGALKALADREGYECFVVPDDTGGRYSVLTAVGLLPAAAAGVFVDELMRGARDAFLALSSPLIEENDCCKYAALRNILAEKGKCVEMTVSYEPSFAMMNEWLKQLFGESEGKDGKGILPASAIFSTDLHSLGQYIQDGQRILFETVVLFKNPKQDYIIESSPDDTDGLNFLAGKGLAYINRKAFEGTALAHGDGGVPVIVLEAEEMNEYELGYMLYFFEKACALSGYISGVNPFNQPGVESYKRNMLALLGKPGLSEEGRRLRERLGIENGE